MRLIYAACCALACVLAPARADDPNPSTATGVVFEDRNGNGLRDADEPGIAQLRVSNGREIVKTDEKGAYRLPVSDDTILFVIKPRDWSTPVDKLNLPRFYYIHYPAGSPKMKYPAIDPTGPLPASVDFPLTKWPEPERFKVLLVGDPQATNLKEVDYVGHDIVEGLAGTDAVLGFSLGDIVFNNLDVREAVNQTMAHIGIPWHNVLGNHDEDYQAADDEHSDDNFERAYGPAYYSFDYGPVHFIVLDDVLWSGHIGKGDDYKSGLGEKQLEFVRNDLKLVPHEQLVVLTMHIPIVQIEERAELYRLLAEHPHVASFSGHLHVTRHWFLTTADGWPGAEPHHHFSIGAACGCWWLGAPDEYGLPPALQQDGTPNGWCIATFEGNRHTVEFRAARRPAEYQMSIWAPEAVAADPAGQTEILVNVFAGSERSTVEMRVGRGEWSKLERVEREDPYYVALKKAEEANPPKDRHKLPGLKKSTHIWRGVLPAELPAGTHLIEVRTMDVYGQAYAGRRILRVE
jgi:hypothetical protein